MSEESKAFPLRDILSVTTGRLLTKSLGPKDNGISAMYGLLEWMTGDAPWTHQLPRFAAECTPWILRWHPRLLAVNERLNDMDARSKESGPDGIEAWLAEQEAEFGSELMLQKIPRDDHDVRNPVDELVEMRGSTDGIVVVVPNEDAL